MLTLTVAIAPAIALIIYFYHKDKFEKEPLSLLAKAFLGGFGITLFAAIVEILLYVVFKPVSFFPLKIFLRSFIIAGCVEEGSKYFIFRQFIYRNKEFNEPYDGILYAVMISLGFATSENIFSVMGSSFTFGPLGILYTGSIRALFAVPAHAFLGVIMGYYLGLAKFSRPDQKQERKYLNRALGFAILAHGLHNFFIFTGTTVGFLSTFVLFAFCWSFSLKAIRIQTEKSVFKK